MCKDPSLLLDSRTSFVVDDVGIFGSEIGTRGSLGTLMAALTVLKEEEEEEEGRVEMRREDMRD